MSLKIYGAQFGNSSTPSQNLTLQVPNTPDGTMKIARGNWNTTLADILTIDASNNIALAAALAVGGATTVAGTLSVTGATTLAVPLPVTSGGTGDSGTAWIGGSASFAPTSGGFGNASGSIWYKRIGRTTVLINASLSIVSNGTGGGSVQMTLPFSCNNGAMLVGREDAATGNGLTGRISPGTSFTNIFTYSNGYPGANGAVIRISGSYETSAA